ncbi:DUF1570 domain-containing protein [Thiorhodovibrio frisius]|uniref:DUF1570 domain-containing protein n=1 Tax=Thiorhodovibrio frisius TaxID=631362 RepID=H8Z616_9GAMM|nr:DUF1570 domain-containing protein [Thiorhodovibrio frisius]EIC20666.1 Protein of unknown function (DUF1570) [Thiorhodovibrio frisius]WPL21414.1 hypothetical protein Thiofri_01539 [Thiorhodovibrio frisius]
MHQWIASLLRISIAVLSVVAIAWALSTDDQRRRLLVRFGLFDSLAQAELAGLRIIGPVGEWELLPKLPPISRYIAPPQPDPGRSRLPEQQLTHRGSEGGRPGASTPSGADAASHGVGHGADPCAVGVARNPSRARRPTEIHRYVDSKGRMVFSDHAPSADAGEVLAVQADASVGRFSADYDFDGLTPPLGFQHQLEIDLDGVFHFLADDLGLRGVQPVHLRLKIIKDQRRFAQAAAGAGLSTNSGFYTHRNNLAVVRWMGDEPTRAVARHEIAHLALGNWLGRTPLWLNEGLAEIVEKMRFQQNFATALAPPQRLDHLRRLARAGQLPALRTFLESERADWDRWGDDMAYPYAWSLVHFLLQEPARQRTVTRLLNELATHRCRMFDDIAFLEGDYAGGLSGLNRDWRRWLFAEAAPLHF